MARCSTLLVLYICTIQLWQINQDSNLEAATRCVPIEIMVTFLYASMRVQSSTRPGPSILRHFKPHTHRGTHRGTHHHHSAYGSAEAEHAHSHTLRQALPAHLKSSGARRKRLHQSFFLHQAASVIRCDNGLPLRSSWPTVD